MPFYTPGMRAPHLQGLGRVRLAVLVASLVVAVTLGAGCSSDDGGQETSNNTSSGDSLVPASLPGITGSPGASTPGPSLECGLQSPGLQGSDAFCALLPEIEAGTVETEADAEFCLLAAAAPPSLAALDFWGRTDQVRLLEQYFTELEPIAPPSLADSTTLLREQAETYLAILERRDAGELTSEEAEAEFSEYLTPLEEANPDLLPNWGAGVIRVCSAQPTSPDIGAPATTAG